MKPALLTTSQDSITRLWSQSDAGTGFQFFSLSGSINPKSHIFLSSSPVKAPKEAITKRRTHWLTGKALQSAILLQKELQTFKESIHQNNAGAKLLDTLKEFPDMIFEISENGTMAIWGIQV